MWQAFAAGENDLNKGPLDKYRFSTRGIVWRSSLIMFAFAWTRGKGKWRARSGLACLISTKLHTVSSSIYLSHSRTKSFCQPLLTCALNGRYTGGLPMYWFATLFSNSQATQRHTWPDIILQHISAFLTISKSKAGRQFPFFLQSSPALEIQIFAWAPEYDRLLHSDKVIKVHQFDCHDEASCILIHSNANTYLVAALLRPWFYHLWTAPEGLIMMVRDIKRLRTNAADNILNLD